MKKLIFTIVILTIIFQTNSVFGQFVDKAEASFIADKWIQMVIDKYGGWGSSKTAIAQSMLEFKNKDRLIGYYCQVEPEGFVIVSLRKELAPVKASSEEGYFDPSEEEGLVMLIRDKMTSLVDAIESRFGNIKTASHEDVESLCEISYTEQWDVIGEYVPGKLSKETGSKDNYNQGQVLLTTSWDQDAPFNNACPDLGCTTTMNGLAPAGCSAIAAAQIMRYWAYPPSHNGGSFLYDWKNMMDEVYFNSPQEQQDAVATISLYCGWFLDMTYTCEVSTAPLDNIQAIFHNDFFYFLCGRIDRHDYSWSDWYEIIKAQLNVNRPIQYYIPAHSIVCDGWRNFSIPEYHINYGWGPGSIYTTWYTIDAIYGGDVNQECMVINIFPMTSLLGLLDGVFPRNPSFPVRYVDIDASGYNGVFDPGQYIQFLKGKTIKGTGNDLGVRFYGDLDLVTILCTDGKYDDGIKVVNGGMKLRNNGMVYIH